MVPTSTVFARANGRNALTAVEWALMERAESPSALERSERLERTVDGFQFGDALDLGSGEQTVERRSASCERACRRPPLAPKLAMNSSRFSLIGVRSAEPMRWGLGVDQPKRRILAASLSSKRRASFPRLRVLSEHPLAAFFVALRRHRRSGSTRSFPLPCFRNEAINPHLSSPGVSYQFRPAPDRGPWPACRASRPTGRISPFRNRWTT